MKSAKVRNSAKAIIIRNHDLLTIELNFPEGISYMLPGGGQKYGETMKETLHRECLEEIGTNITIGELLHLQEYRSKNHEWAEKSVDMQQLICIFSCKVSEDYEAKSGANTDPKQIGVKWLPIKNLEKYKFYPSYLIPIIKQNIKSEVYLGDIN